MAYIGNDPSNRFVAPKAASVFSGDGSTTAFTLDHAVGSDEDILVSVDGVIQEPSVAYAVSNGTTLTFTAAPSSNSGNNIFVYYLFRTVGTVSHPSNNALTASTGTFSGAVSVSDDVTIADKIIHSGDTNTAIRFPDADTVSFETGGSERARISSSGHLLVGKTAANTTDVGARVNAFGRHDGTVDGGLCGIFNRLTNAGNLFQFEALNTAVGFIAVPTTSANDISLASSRGGGIRLSDAEFIPCDANGGLRNDAIDLGHPSAFFDDIRATNSSIITSSDKTLKQDIEELSDKEKKVAVACKGLMRKYRWKSRVEKKGDDARIHFGIMAQDLQDAFIAEGLDPTKYAMFCSDTVWEIDEKTTEDGKEIIRKNSFKVESEAPKGAIKREVLAVRYTELLAFIISAI